MFACKLALADELIFVAVIRRQLCGAIVAGYDGVRGWLYHLAVHPSQRRRQVGTALVRAAEHELMRLGCTKVNLQIRADNAGVAEFYRSLGYAEEPRVSMGKTLSALPAQAPQRQRS